ncbi:MAG: chromosomal replication initiator protein DnaA [Dehalococcoidia bacterium]|nr:chromosomal replication initiator protein DnaA [Dehalococcoidia bacterium]
MDSAKEIWERALGELQLQVSRANYTTWLEKSCGISFQKGIFVVGAPNAFVAEWLIKRLHSLIRKTLTQITGTNVDVQFIVHDKEQLQSSSLASASQTDGGTSTKARIDRFNPRYTFSNFIVGDCNRLAYAATVETVENPGHTYNPLFIYSSTGQGKTHLLHAIGHRAVDNGLCVTYTSAEQFTNEFIKAIKQKQVEDFRGKFKNTHLFLFDDMQFIINKKQTLQCFFQIFSELYNNNRQIIITADHHPKDMAPLSDKFKSHLEWGLIASIQPPDLKTRLAILSTKAQEMALAVSDEVLQLLAKRTWGNIRQLEGALIYLTARAKLIRAELTPQIVNMLLTSTTAKKGANLILQTVADYFNLSTEELRGDTRNRKIALARQIAMYLMKEEDNCSFTEIGKLLGNRSHATIIYGHRKIATQITTNPKLHRQILEISEKINPH